jgi:copper chaperone
MTESISLNVTGMKCGGCESAVKGKLQQLEGIQSIQVSHQENKVEVEFDEHKTSLDVIKQTITDAGYAVQ